MTRSPKISVVMSVYNHGIFVEEAICLGMRQYKKRITSFLKGLLRV